MEVKSVQKYIITSPKKIREVVPLIKELSPSKAYEVLPFSGKRAGEKLRKVIGTALANARQIGLSEENLFFKEIQVSDGPRLKRWRAGARGMAKPYVRKMSHIRVVLGVKEVEKPIETPNKKGVNTKSAKETGGTEKKKSTEKKKGIGSLVGRVKKSKTEKADKTEKKRGKEKKA